MALSLQTIPGQFTLQMLRQIWQTEQAIDLGFSEEARRRIQETSDFVQEIARGSASVYGINTGFGLLANTTIPPEDVDTLQENLVMSHCAGVGKPLADNVVRLILALKASSLAQGYSGVRLDVVNLMLSLLKEQIYPVIPEKGSVGASGDLAPLAHLAAALIGIGEIDRRPASDVLRQKGLDPLTLKAKEGLAILNGTNVSTALALNGLFQIENVFAAAMVSGALSVDAMLASDTPFDDRIHRIRKQPGQCRSAALYRELLEGSEIRQSHSDCTKVQDAYSLRCQPQVMGAALDIIGNAAQCLLDEANSVTDNPLIFLEDGDVLSGGNFHAEPVAFASDVLALAICEIGSISERRLSNMIDPKMSGLPPFLTENPGINSGFMIAQVTAAALVAENKMKAHPASIDSIPTSANQEDHVSMATHGARRLNAMAENAGTVIAIEILAACQALEFHQPRQTSPTLLEVYKRVRELVPAMEGDRFMADDLEAIKSFVLSGGLFSHAGAILPSGQI